MLFSGCFLDPFLNQHESTATQSMKTWMGVRNVWTCWYPWSMTLQAFPGRLIHVDAPESEISERWEITWFESWNQSESKHLAAHLRWVRSSPALLAWNGIGPASTSWSLVRQNWMALCTMWILQRRECPCHCQRHEVQTRYQSLCLGHLCGDSNVEARHVRSPWTWWAADHCRSTRNFILFTTGESIRPLCSLLCLPFLGAQLHQHCHGSWLVGRFELRQADLGEGGLGLLDMPLCVEPARRGGGGGGKSSAGAIQRSTGASHWWCSDGFGWRSEAIFANLVPLRGFSVEGLAASLWTDMQWGFLVPAWERWTQGCEHEDARNHMPGLVERVHCQGWKLSSQGQIPDLGRNGQRIHQGW